VFFGRYLENIEKFRRALRRGNNHRLAGGFGLVALTMTGPTIAVGCTFFGRSGRLCLLDLLDAIPGELPGRTASPFFYARLATRYENERLTDEDRDYSGGAI
jgi:hypothetical protein